MEKTLSQDSEYTRQLEKIEAVANALISALERKHPYTKGHSEQVGLYARDLALALVNPKLAPSLVNDIHLGARLHDIGKICVEITTLDNPGRSLTPDQIVELEDHPYHGIQILRKCGIEIPREVFNCVFFHHERFDGKHDGNLTGYPFGIAGKDIPLEARIVSVADIYDALRSARPYKEPFSVSESVKILKGLSGNKLDPDLVDIFVAKVIK